MTNVPDLWAMVLLTLAVYRISRLIVVDAFPPMASFRRWFKYHWPDTGDMVNRNPKRGIIQSAAPQGTSPQDIEQWRVVKGTSLGYLISCMYCTPFWVAVLVWLSWNWFPDQTLFVCTPFALASLATFCYTRIDQR